MRDVDEVLIGKVSSGGLCEVVLKVWEEEFKLCDRVEGKCVMMVYYSGLFYMVFFVCIICFCFEY